MSCFQPLLHPLQPRAAPIVYYLRLRGFIFRAPCILWVGVWCATCNFDPLRGYLNPTMTKSGTSHNSTSHITINNHVSADHHIHHPATTRGNALSSIGGEGARSRRGKASGGSSIPYGSHNGWPKQALKTTRHRKWMEWSKSAHNSILISISIRDGGP